MPSACVTAAGRAIDRYRAGPASIASELSSSAKDFGDRARFAG
jgi:hypothetical protein